MNSSNVQPLISTSSTRRARASRISSGEKNDEVLRLAGQGFAPAEIAESLGLSEGRDPPHHRPFPPQKCKPLMHSRVQFPPGFKPLIDPVLQIKLSQQPPPGLSVGQTVEARVLERLGDGRFVISVGDSHLTAEAESALRPGQTMALRVNSFSPRVPLSVPSLREGSALRRNTCVSSGSNPGALQRASVELEGIFGGPRASDLTRLVGRDNLKAILDGLDLPRLAGSNWKRGFSSAMPSGPWD